MVDGDGNFVFTSGRENPLDATPVYFLAGKDSYLRSRHRSAIKHSVLGDENSGLTTFDGAKASWGEVHVELTTLSMFTPRRLVVVENGDAFVSAHREQFETYLKTPAAGAVLVVEVESLPANTRLAKQLGKAKVVCDAPAKRDLPQWCVEYAKEQQKVLGAAAASLVVELAGAESLGVLAGEVDKLVAYAGDGREITVEAVRSLVGDRSVENVWHVMDRIAAGDVAGALDIIDGIFGASGGTVSEEKSCAISLLNRLGSQLRKLAGAARLCAGGMPLREAVLRVGVPPFAAASAEAQIKWLGRRRCAMLYDWLVELDVGMKGGSEVAPRVLLERLVVKLGVPRDGG